MKEYFLMSTKYRPRFLECFDIWISDPVKKIILLKNIPNFPFSSWHTLLSGFWTLDAGRNGK